MLDIYFYENKSILYYITSESDELKQIPKYNRKDLGKVNTWEINNMMDGYYKTHTSLLRFREDFNNWRTTFEKETGYKMMYSWEVSAYQFFVFILGKHNIELLEKDSDDIVFGEFKLIESCYNSGLASVNPKCVNKSILCYAYDYSSYYPTKLSSKSFNFPIKKPIFKDDIDLDNLEYGIYNVSIISNDIDFKNTFSFSPKNWYSHYSLEYAVEMSKLNKCEIQIIGGSWIYEESSLINGHKIFGKWLKKIKELKKKYPKNKLIKMMSSTLWGVLIQYKRTFMTEDEFFNSDVSYMDDDSETEYKYLSEKTRVDENDEIIVNYEVVTSNNPYKRQVFARLKPFLTSFCRTNISRIVKEFDLYDNLVRIQTDSICLNVECDFGNYSYKPIFEDKSSGLITWYNVNNSNKIKERKLKKIKEYEKELELEK